MATTPKQYRLEQETLDRIDDLAKIWSQAEPLAGAQVLREAVKRAWDAEQHKKKAKKSRPTA